MANGELAVAQEHQLDGKTLLSVVAGGDCAALTAEQKVMYYRARCEAAGLDYRAQPFQFIKLQGKEVLYATKAATDQLASKHGVVVEIASQVTESGIRTVTVRARAKDGRQTDEIGCVSVGNATGDLLCNIQMKAVTKAKRRAILSICGLGMLDETELETIPNTSAPPALPLPPRRSEKARKAPEAAPAVIDAPMGNPGSFNAALDAPDEANEPLVVPDRDSVDPSGIEVKVLDISVKPTKKGGKSYGIRVQEADGDPYYVNTFSDTDVDVARSCKDKPEMALIEKKPREYQGKTYWDLVSIAPSIPF